jgi:CBS domain containing-hemolysin-like protein
MTTLLLYLALAIVFSFFCSIAEAVLLSITPAYIGALEKINPKAALRLKRLKQRIDSPLAAILSLNTIAHTVGAAGVGAQAAILFGSQYLGLTSAILTFLILFFSEIIPKTIGTVYWRHLAPAIGYSLGYLIIALYPLVWLSKLVTEKIANKPTTEGFDREEFAAMASLGHAEGDLQQQEVTLLHNVLVLRDKKVADVMTPGTVMFSLPESNTVSLFFNKYPDKRFSRIPVYKQHEDDISGFVLRNDLLTAQARGNTEQPLANYRRQLFAIPDKLSLLAAFNVFLERHAHMMYVIDEYGAIKGLITLEDILEELMGEEIVDESDRNEDMQQLAKQQWRKKARQLGIDIDTDDNSTG